MTTTVSISVAADPTLSSSPIKRPRQTCPDQDYQFFVTLIPDDDPESLAFSGIHAKSLLVSKVFHPILLTSGILHPPTNHRS